MSPRWSRREASGYAALSIAIGECGASTPANTATSRTAITIASPVTAPALAEKWRQNSRSGVGCSAGAARPASDARSVSVSVAVTMGSLLIANAGCAG